MTGTRDFINARWRTADSVNLAWVHWDDGAAVFHRPSGKTHFLNPASVRLLALLDERERSALQAASDLAALEGVQQSREYTEQVENTLYRLGQLGLAQCMRG